MGEIGGVVRQVLWDGIDCHRARMLSWIAESLRSWLKGLPRYNDLEFRRFLRSYQHACLQCAKAGRHGQAPRLWHANHPGT